MWSPTRSVVWCRLRSMSRVRLMAVNSLHGVTRAADLSAGRGQILCPAMRDACVEGPALAVMHSAVSSAQPVIAAGRQRALIRRAGVDAREEIRQSRVPLRVQPPARGGRLQRKAELDVRGAEPLAAEPSARPQLAFQVVQVQRDLRIEDRKSVV